MVRMPESIKNPIFFHIGYHRTGTTFLQKDVFKSFTDKAIFSLPFNDNAFISRYFIKDLLTKDLIDMSEVEYKKSLYELSTKKKGKPIVASLEALSGTMWADNYFVPERIHNLLPKSKIIIVIRSQFTIIPSFYQYLYLKNLTKFGGKLLTFKDFYKKIINNNKLNYFKLILKYQTVFGPRNIKVLFYEDLKRNEEHFLNQLFNFIGVEKVGIKYHNEHINQRYSLMEAVGVVKINSILNSRHLKRFETVFPKKINTQSLRTVKSILNKANKVNSRVKLIKFDSFENDINFRSEINSYYKESNRKLFQILGINNTEHEYPL
jgi:hypothetical protein